MKQYFATVIIEGRGRKRIITCSGEYDYEIAREDKRKDNGTKLIYEYEINSLVLDFVLKNCKNKFLTMSLSKWLVSIGLIDWQIVNASNNKLVMQEHLKLLEEKYPNNATTKDMLEHFINVETDKLKRNLASVFHKLEKHKIIIYKKEWYGCLLNKERRVLTEHELTEIANHKRELCNKHNVNLRDLRFKTKNPSVKAYKEDFASFLNSMGFKYIYESHGCVVQVSDNIIKEYLDNLNEKDELVFCYGLSETDIFSLVYNFKRLFTERSLELAKARQDNKDNNSDHQYIKQLKVFEEYLPIWEILLILYGLTNYREPTILRIEHKHINVI
ncbi:hypothetical protein [Halalkalibacter alkalisediminis]|uniref:Uncharacterized protein n=1 Tax=Halalkalibacter alkalisediminis TaxID=935616 RepID=A0ABV6NN24_9BACI|nr:hypothetical protein [Halalkalibacter alkalisediminis]